MPRRALIAAGLVALAVAAIVHFWPVSDEERIRRLIRDAAADYNASRAGGVLDAFDESYRDRTTRADRQLLRQFLAAIYLARQNQHEGELRYPASIAGDDIAVAITAAEPPEATARLRAIIADRAAGGAACWEIEVEARLRKGEDGWLIRETEHETISGRSPF